MERVNQIVEIIRRHQTSVQAIYLFGSFATENERPDSDVDIALLLPPEDAKKNGSLCLTELQGDLERLLDKNIDLINLRCVSTVFQIQILFAERRIYDGDTNAAEEFEMLTLSLYQKLNEERAGIIETALQGGRFHQV